MAEVRITPDAASQLEALPPVIHSRVLKVLERLRSWPTLCGVKPLRGRLAGSFRVRTGDYRVQFRVRSGGVIVERIGHRDRFYEN